MDGDVEALLIVGQRQPARRSLAGGRKGAFQEVRRLPDEDRTVLLSIEDQQRVDAGNRPGAPVLQQERTVELPVGEANAHSCFRASTGRAAACRCWASPGSAADR